MILFYSANETCFLNDVLTFGMLIPELAEGVYNNTEDDIDKNHIDDDEKTDCVAPVLPLIALLDIARVQRVTDAPTVTQPRVQD